MDSLATETDYVRGRLAEYANDLLTLGVDGLRLDASKRTHTFGALRPTLIMFHPQILLLVISKIS